MDAFLVKLSAEEHAVKINELAAQLEQQSQTSDPIRCPLGSATQRRSA
jgi:hypothetical protein